MRFKLLTFFLLIFQAALPATPSEAKLKMLYASLDPTSLKQHLAFYELYSDTTYGQKALQNAWQIVANQINDEIEPLFFQSSDIVKELACLIKNRESAKDFRISAEKLQALNKLTKNLKHKTLAGHRLYDEQSIAELDANQIDVARALLVGQYEFEKSKIDAYEAMLDIFALQVMARVKNSHSPQEMIDSINYLIFNELDFRFPPKSIFKKGIDSYTFLPSVLDSHQGVCLGISIIYLALAQRVGLPMEAVTPPGHIYVRYKFQDKIINVETTARGIDLDCDNYRSIDTPKLQVRDNKEVVGLAYINQASLYWQTKEFDKACRYYQKALIFLPGDALLKELLGFALILNDQKTAGEELLKTSYNSPSVTSYTKSELIEDYFSAKVLAQDIPIIFTPLSEKRSELSKELAEIEKVLQQSPQFRDGIIKCSMIYLQLHQVDKAAEQLHKVLQLSPQLLGPHYYLAQIYFSKKNYKKCWHHIAKCENILENELTRPKCLKDLKKILIQVCPPKYNQAS